MESLKEKGIIGNKIDQSEAVSEIIGVVLMISLVVIGVGIVSVVIIGQDTPVEIPSLSMIPASGETDLYLYHTGGDSLKRGEFFVRVDGLDYYPADIEIIDQGGNSESDWDSWDLGESLIIEDKSDYNQILILSTRGGGAAVIAGSGDAVVTYTSTATTTATVTVTPTPAQPVADFTANITSGYAPLTVRFTDLSTGGPTSWSWDFGDSGASAVQNPEHTYSSPGTYSVSLTALNSGGSDTETKIGYITVAEAPSAPVADFTADVTSGVEPLEVSFTDLSTENPTSWQWNFGDGEISTEQNPVHEYTSPGTYTVSLNATNAYGSDIEQKFGYIIVEELVLMDIELDTSRPYYLISGGFFKFSVTGDWSDITFDGSTIDLPSGTDVRIELASNQSGTVGMNSGYIWDFSFDDVNLYLDGELEGNGPITDISISGYSGVSSTLSMVVPYPGESESTYLEVDGDVILPYWPVETPEVRIYNIYPDSGGLFSIYSETDLTCGAVSYELIEPPIPPVADFDYTILNWWGTPRNVRFTDVSGGNPTSWLWDFGDGGTSTEQNPVHGFTPRGKPYSVTLTVTNDYGSDSTSQSLHLN